MGCSIHTAIEKRFFSGLRHGSLHQLPLKRLTNRFLPSLESEEVKPKKSLYHKNSNKIHCRSPAIEVFAMRSAFPGKTAHHKPYQFSRSFQRG